MEVIKKIYEGKSIPILPVKHDLGTELYNEALDVMNATIESNMKIDEDGNNYCDVQVV